MTDYYKRNFSQNREKQAKVHPGTVNGNELLTELIEIVKKYIIVDDEVIVVAVLWCILTWCMDIAYYAPILHITSSDEKSGKTKLLNIIKRLTCNPEIVSSITKAALFRKVSEHQETLLFDKLEKSFLKQKDVINMFVSGFINDGRSIVCCIGKGNDPKPYRTWGAKAICNRGIMPEEINAASIVLPLRRKLKNERVTDIIASNPEIWHKLTAKIARFVADNKEIISTIDVPHVEELTDSTNECWNSLFRIALAAEGNWFEIVKKAAISLTIEDQQIESSSIELLKSIKAIFHEKQEMNISSEEICSILNRQYFNLKILNKEELTPRSLANILKVFGISPNTVNLSNGKKLKGYKQKQFIHTFNQYLPDD